MDKRSHSRLLSEAGTLMKNIRILDASTQLEQRGAWSPNLSSRGPGSRAVRALRICKINLREANRVGSLLDTAKFDLGGNYKLLPYQ